MVSGFPRMYLTLRMPCTAFRSPLFTPDVRISRIRRSQIPLAAGLHKELTVHLHRLQTQLGQVLIVGRSFRGTEGPLAPPAQMPDQTLTYVPADLPKRPPGMAQSEVFPPSFQVSVYLPHEPANRLETHVWACHLSQSLFGIERGMNLLLNCDRKSNE
jgi:hypothetical protein